MKVKFILLGAFLISVVAIQSNANIRMISGNEDPGIATDTTQGPPKDRKWKMVWNDEFDGTKIDTTRWVNIGRSLDFTHWNYPGIKTRYSDENCLLNGKGSLEIVLSRDKNGLVLFNRGIFSKIARVYGYYEARVQFSTQPGWWAGFWLSDLPYNEGNDPFIYPQEFDIVEDLDKPKIENTVSQCYHVNQDLPYGVDNGWGVKSKMISAKSIYKIFLPKTTLLDKYNGWHTVALEWTPLEYIFYVDGKITTRENYTEVPVTTLPLKIIISGEFRDPKGSEKPFYGWLKDASYPDKFIVDYVRVYNEDFGGRTAPKVTLTPVGHINGIKSGKPVKFRVKAEDKDGIVKALYLFSKGRIRAEINVNSADAEQIITLTNLFPGDNTLIAMAKDNDGQVGVSTLLHIHILP